jgi:hypothetical protein
MKFYGWGPAYDSGFPSFWVATISPSPKKEKDQSLRGQRKFVAHCFLLKSFLSKPLFVALLTSFDFPRCYPSLYFSIKGLGLHRYKPGFVRHLSVPAASLFKLADIASPFWVRTMPSPRRKILRRGATSFACQLFGRPLGKFREVSTGSNLATYKSLRGANMV